MNVLSLFDGMACGRIALERAGFTVDRYFACEIDKHAMFIANKNYPDIVQLGSVVDLNIDDLPWIDLLIGGSPCQGFSFAGKQLAFDDPRSKLFFEYVRILEGLRKKNPNIKFMLENVRMKKIHEQVITDYLGVQPVHINSALVSAQNRRRVYWTNIYQGIAQPFDRGVLLPDILETEVDVKYLISEKALERVLRLDPKINPKKAYAVTTHNNSSNFSSKRSGTLIGCTSYNGKLLYADKANCIDANFAKGPDNHGQRTFIEQRPRGFNRGGIHVDKSPTLSANSWHHNNTLHHNNTYRRLTPIECCRLQTVPDGYTDGISDTQQYRMLGNGWNVDTIVHILSYLDPWWL